MKKNIKVILKTRISNIGDTNTLTKVSLGYAYNYLIPNNLAEIATTGKIRHFNMIQKIKEKKTHVTNQKNQIIKESLDSITVINLWKNVSSSEQIFGSITENDIRYTIKQITGQSINKKQIYLPPVKSIGQYHCNINITDSIKTSITINILPISL